MSVMYGVMFINDNGEDEVLAVRKTKADAEEYIDDNIKYIADNINSEVWVQKIGETK